MLYSIGYAFRLGGRLKESREIQEKVLELKRCTLGQEHRGTLSIMQNLVATYKELGGKLEEVQELEEKALEVRKRTLGEEHPVLCGVCKILQIHIEIWVEG